MQLAIKNKWITVGDSSTVQDMDGKDVFKVKGKVFSFTRKKIITDMEDNVKYVVRNKFWTWFAKKAIIYNDRGEEVVRVRRKIFSVHDRYFFESPLGNIEIIGNILGFDYKILVDGKEIGHIARKISFRDSFVLTIPDNVDSALYVALVIAIDNITDARRSESENSYNDNDD